MDIGKINNLLIWTVKNHKKPIRINDVLLTKVEVQQLVIALEKAINKT